MPGVRAWHSCPIPQPEIRRITLEAKRLLAHTVKPIYLIAEGLGFAEATNFSKFFKRETGLTPAEFRAGN